MTIIDGKKLANELQEKMRQKVEKMAEKPGLLVILVGENPASQVYVKNKGIAARKIGICSETVNLPETVSEAELLDLIERYNQDENWHGILVQLPLPKHISEEKVLQKISPAKDVDGFHPLSMGLHWSGKADMVPSTPAGIMEMLKAYNVEIAGKNAVVIGRSNIVGKPMAQMLLDCNATVTIAHSRTENLSDLTKTADILVVAIGKAKFVTADMVKNGAVVIDVGMNRDENGKLCGDVDFDSVEKIASLITPVPGGVGPMTITMLMEQTIRAAEKMKK